MRAECAKSAHHIWALALLAVTQAVVSPLATAQSTLKVVYSPNSLTLSSGQAIDSSSVADFLSLALGYSLAKPFEWDGLTAITDVLALPKASWTVRVGTDDVVNATLVFPIIATSLLDQEFDILSERTRQRFKDKPLIVKMDSISDLKTNVMNDHPDLENGVNLNKLDASKFDPEDDNIKNYILEINAIKQTLESIKKSKAKDGKSWSHRDIFWFNVNHLSAITESNAYDESVKTDAKHLMSSLIDDLKRELAVIYDNRVIISVIEDKQMFEPLVRKTRETSGGQRTVTSGNYSALNLAHQFQSDFHTAFAMVAFVSILMAVTVFGISVAMWNLDPGKDSIIYRMTSQRIKKDQ